MSAGCPFITCAIKKKQVEFCWDCKESLTCDKWKKHLDAGKSHDSFKCYQKLEEDVAFIQERGIRQFEEAQKAREAILRVMLREFNEGRSKSHYCIAATILTIDELQEALDAVRRGSGEADMKTRSSALHSALDKVAAQNSYVLRLRK
jgi:predicted transcriptional regulator